MEVKTKLRDPDKVSLSPEYRCPFNRGDGYKDYVNIFPGPKFVSPEWRCPKGEVPLYMICHTFFQV